MFGTIQNNIYSVVKIYLICAEIGGEKLHKIGYTRRTIEQRIKEFKTGNASEFSIVDSFQSKWGTMVEAQLHRIFVDKKVNDEWFDLDEDDILMFRNCFTG
jgi:phosphopentomutase